MVTCPYCTKEIPSKFTPSSEARLYACTVCMNPIVLSWHDNKVEAGPVPHTRDIRTIAEKGSVGAAILDALPKAIKNLPVLPEVAQHVMNMTSNPDISMPQLAEVVRDDQVIAIKILKLANSPVHRGFQEITDLDAACTRLGMKTISNAVQAIANGNLYITGNEKLRGMMERLWKHAVASAHFASSLATILVEPRSEALFVAGLIHDVGKVVLLDILANSYTERFENLTESEEFLHDVLKNFHPIVGLHVTQLWGLPPEFGISTFCHHNPEYSPNPEYNSMVHITAMANALAKAEGYIGTEEEETFLSGHPSAQFLNLNDIKLASLRVDLEDELAALMETVRLHESPA